MIRRVAACAVALCLLYGEARADELASPQPLSVIDCPCPPAPRPKDPCCENRFFRNAKWSWENDPLLSLGDGAFTFNVRLNSYLDYQAFDDDQYVAEGGRAGPQTDEWTVNRLRLGFDGQIGKYTTYRFTYELASLGDVRGFGQGAAGVRDLYLDVSRLHEKHGEAFPDIRVGSFTEPFGLEDTRGARTRTFMTRAATNLFGPGRSAGIMLSGNFDEDRFGYRVGAFTGSQVTWNLPSLVWPDTDPDRDGFNVAGRLIWSPTGNDCCVTAHFGVSYLHAWGLTSTRFQSRPENRAADHVIDTNFSTGPAGVPLLSDTRGVDIVGAEVMLLRGRWMFQAEGLLCAVQSAAGGDPTFGGAYAYVACMLTGERYQRRNGDLAGITPCDVWDPVREGRQGRGAWEAAVRYTYVDLNSANVRGGTLNNVTAGMNWIASSTLRLQFNYVNAHVNDGVADAPIHIFQTRLEIDL